MTREIAHLKQFEAALDAITQNFPPGKLPGVKPFDHLYFIDNDSGEKKPQGFELAASSPFGFESKTADEVGEEPPPIDPRPTLASKPAKSHNGHAAHLRQAFEWQAFELTRQWRADLRCAGLLAL